MVKKKTFETARAIAMLVFVIGFSLYLLFFLGGDNGDLNILGTTAQDVLETPFECETDSNCEDFLVVGELGTQEDIDRFNEFYELKCMEQMCVGVTK